MKRVYPRVMMGFCVGLTAVPVLASAAGRPSSLVFLLCVGCGFILLAILFTRAVRHPMVYRSAAIGFLLVAAIPVSEWPLRGSFFLVQGRLNRIAADVRAGVPVRTPFHVGLFHVQAVEVRPWKFTGDGIRVVTREPVPSTQQVICLWVDRNSAGPSVLAQCARAEVQFNVFTLTTLNPRWQFVIED